MNCRLSSMTSIEQIEVDIYSAKAVEALQNNEIIKFKLRYHLNVLYESEPVMSNMPTNLLIDFVDSETIRSWQAVDDRIMGGQSQSRVDHAGDAGLRFTGNVSFANNGGFASIRSGTGHWKLDQFSGLTVRLRGDGKTYKLSLRTDLYFDGISYQTSFATVEGTWQEIFLPFKAFLPTHHGVKVNSAAPLDVSCIRSFGFFIADRQEGRFRLDVAWIKGE
jgi:NADH dehydrogenase [ubiquinone] 1 alpha subcomplex assembly factor 1